MDSYCYIYGIYHVISATYRPGVYLLWPSIGFSDQLFFTLPSARMGRGDLIVDMFLIMDIWYVSIYWVYCCLSCARTSIYLSDRGFPYFWSYICWQKEDRKFFTDGK